MMTRTDLDSIRAYLGDAEHLDPDKGHEIAIELLEELERSRMREWKLAGEVARLKEQRDRYNLDAIRAHVELARLRNPSYAPVLFLDECQALFEANGQGKTTTSYASGPT